MSDVSESERQPRRRYALGSRLYFSVALIAVGVLLFLGNLGIVPIHDLWIIWPALPIILGVGRLISSTNASSLMWSLLMVLFGLLFLFSNFGWIYIHTDDNSWILSLLLIGIGFSVLQSRGAIAAGPRSPRALMRTPGSSSGNWLNDLAVLGSVKRKVESDDFTGGDVTSIFGNVEIDLRRARISSSDNSAVLNITAVFGAAKIRVPEGWRVDLNAASILANFEDKTVPPNTGRDAPRLAITGLSILSSVEIED